MPILRWKKPRSRSVPTGYLQWRTFGVEPQIANFIFVLSELHQVSRQGWTDRGATVPEWVLDHQSYVAHAVLQIGEYLVPGSLKVNRAFWLALVHDIGELKGDRTPHHGLNPRDARSRRKYFSKLPALGEDVTAELKRLKDTEEESSMEILSSFMTPRLSLRYYRAWNEYREQATAEAQFVRQIHALVDCVRATRYKTMQPKEEFRTFFDTARTIIRDPVLLSVVDRFEAVYETIGKDRSDD